MSKKPALLVAALALFVVVSVQAQFTTIHYQDGVNHPFSGSSSMSGAGDVNADGVPDYIVGSPGNQGQPVDFGFVQVLSGADGSLLHQITGTTLGDSFGFSVSGAGDVNNDGHDDFVVGIPADSTAGQAAGACKVFSGLDGSEIYYIQGLAAFESSGRSVAGLGDIDGDGHGDFAVGEPRAAVGASEQGRVRLFSGIDGSLIRTYLGVAGSRFGTSLADAQDVDGDGTDDLIVGSPNFGAVGANPALGRIRVFSGSTGLVVLTRAGSSFGDGFGTSVDGVGDMNGDGFADVIASSPTRIIPSTANVGRVRVLSGFDGSVLHIVKGTFFYNAGGSIAGLGDVDGDNVPDFAVGRIPSLNGLGIRSREIRIFSGASMASLADLPAPVGTVASHQVVVSVADLDGDGLAEIAVGAFGALSNAGEVRVYQSSLDPIVNYQSNSGNIPALDLNWIPDGGNIHDAMGAMQCNGATPGASGIILVSLAPADIPIFGFDLLCAVDNANLALLATIGASASGEFFVPDISRRSPFLAGNLTYVQFIEIAPIVQASNGIRFVVIP